MSPEAEKKFAMTFRKPIGGVCVLADINDWPEPPNNAAIAISLYTPQW